LSTGVFSSEVDAGSREKIHQNKNLELFHVSMPAQGQAASFIATARRRIACSDRRAKSVSGTPDWRACRARGNGELTEPTINAGGVKRPSKWTKPCGKYRSERVHG
jgi:hypothetical protein